MTSPLAGHNVRRGAWLLLAVGAVIAFGVLFWPRSGPPSPAHPDQPVLSRSRHVRVMTFNINMIEPTAGPHRWDIQQRILPQIIHKYQPDLIGFQACTPVQTAWLADRFRQFRHYPVSRGLAQGLFSAISGAIGTWNQIFYSTRFRRLAGAHGLVRPGALRNNATENAYYSLVVLGDRSGVLPPIILLDTHLRHGNQNAVADAGRLHGIVASFIKRFPHSRVIVLGDMNHPRTDLPVYNQLLGPPSRINGGFRWSDTFNYNLKPAGVRWGTVQYYVGRPGLNWPSDLIFVGPGWKWSAAKIIRMHGPHGNYASDHFPVFTVLTPGAAAAEGK